MQGKSLIRNEFLARRRSTDASTADQAAQAVARRVMEALPPGPGVVAGYAAVRGELPLKPLLERLHAKGVTLALPCVQPESRVLLFRRWAPGEKLLPGMYGILEPETSAETVLPDIVLAPLVAFDRQGMRLGYGAGYYDATLAHLRAQGVLRAAIGIAYAAQEALSLPREAHDVPLDQIVTEQETIRCSDFSTL